MVRHHQQPVILSGSLKSFRQRTDQSPVQIPDGLHFPFRTSLMAHLIRSLHMDIRKIIPFFGQRVNRCLRFSLIIRVESAVCPFHNDICQSGAYSDAF